MLRHSNRLARAVVTGFLVTGFLVTCVLAGCGIKGPLTPASQPEAARDSGSDTAPRKP